MSKHYSTAGCGHHVEVKEPNNQPQSFSSDPSAQFFCRSHLRSRWTHSPLTQRNCLGEHGLGTGGRCGVTTGLTVVPGVKIIKKSHIIHCSAVCQRNRSLLNNIKSELSNTSSVSYHQHTKQRSNYDLTIIFLYFSTCEAGSLVNCSQKSSCLHQIFMRTTVLLIGPVITIPPAVTHLRRFYAAKRLACKLALHTKHSG